jgi:hypothetical protein
MPWGTPRASGRNSETPVGPSSRTSDVEITVSPPVATPRQTVTAAVTAAEAIDEVTAARLEWGYTNFFHYRWAGDAEGGPSAGGDRDTDEWVSVTRVDLPIAAGEFAGGSWTFRLPSWAPASSTEIARWSARLVVERGSRDIDTHGEFAVKIGPADVVAEDDPMEVLTGAAATAIDIVLPTSVFVAGETIRGQAILTPTVDLPDGDLAVSWQRRRVSHPLNRDPSPEHSLDGRIMVLGDRIPLRGGVPITMPFEIPLPADAPPTSAAVHSSMDWYVQARMFYAGSDSHLPERVVRPIVVVNTS